MPQKFILTFSDQASLNKVKQEVLKNGGTVVNESGPPALLLIATLPDDLVSYLQSNLKGQGITSFEPDGVVTAQGII